MIQLEQQQHREFWVGWVGHIPTTYIQLAGAGSTNLKQKLFRMTFTLPPFICRLYSPKAKYVILFEAQARLSSWQHFKELLNANQAVARK